MNITNRARRVLGIAVLAGSVAGAVGLAGATRADSTVPIDPAPTEAPAEPITDEAPPGVDDSGVAGPTTTAPAATEPSSTEPSSTEPDVAPSADDMPMTPSADDIPMTPSVDDTTVTTVSAIATTTSVAPTDDGQQSLLATTPTAPLSVIASPYGSQTVWLYWNPPADDGGAPVIQYQIQWATSANGPWQFFATTPNIYYKASSGNWNNGTRYYFRILASNTVGWGAPSAVVSAIPRTVPSAPAGCSAWYEGKYYYGYGSVFYKFHVNWVAGSNGGVPITSYKVTVWKNGYYYTHSVTNVFLATSMAMTVWSPGSYVVTVQAGNSAGYGPACQTSIWVV
jgi:hypothetical protein